MSLRKAIVWLSLFLVMSLVLTWLTMNTLRRGVSGPTSEYSAVFTDISGLRAGDDVRVAGVRIGRVDGVELDGNLARVRFRVDASHPLTQNTKAAVIYQNIIGQRYLGLSLADYDSPEELTPGSEIPLAHTDPSFDISVLLNGFEPLFNVLDPDNVNDLSQALVGAMQGDTGSITQLLAQTSDLAETMSGPEAVLDDVIANLAVVLSNIAEQSGNVEGLIVSAQETFAGFADHRQRLLDSAETIALVGNRIAEIAADVRPDLDAFLTRQPGFAHHFNTNKSKFEYLAFNGPAMMKGLARISQEGSFLSAYVCDLNPVGFAPFLDPLVPQLVGAATPGGKPTYSPICQS